jgi:hypothetical protein
MYFRAVPHFNRSVFLHRLKQFSDLASRAARSLGRSHSNLILSFSSLENLRLSFVYHFNRFVFHHQLKQLPARASGVVRIWRLSFSKLEYTTTNDKESEMS